MVRFLTLLSLMSALIVACAAHSPHRDVQDLRADVFASKLAADHADKAAAQAKIAADQAAIRADEALTERHNLLREAVLAIAVVALCLVAAAKFPLLATELRALAGAAGAFAAMVMALRSLLSVPDRVILLVLAIVGAIALLRVLWHAGTLSHVAHELSATGKADIAAVSGKTARFMSKVRARASHLIARA